MMGRARHRRLLAGLDVHATPGRHDSACDSRMRSVHGDFELPVPCEVDLRKGEEGCDGEEHCGDVAEVEGVGGGEACDQAASHRRHQCDDYEQLEGSASWRSEGEEVDEWCLLIDKQTWVGL